MEFDLVFEGGGAKGMVFVGAMQAIEGAGHTTSRLLGTSAGAITAALLAAGYTQAEMMEALGEKENELSVFTGFMGAPGPFDDSEVRNSATIEFIRAVDLPLVPEFLERKLDAALANLLAKSEKYCHLFSYVEYGGWYSATRFRSWLEAKLDSGRFNGAPRQFSAMTLKEFFESTGNEIALVASDTTGQQPLILNHRTAPDCPLVWAVRGSMSIPFIWQEVEWRSEWGPYRGQDISGHVIVDGGLLSNFPIELLVSNAPHIVAAMGEKKTGNVIGLLIDESIPVANAPTASKTSSRFEFGKLKSVQRLIRLVDTMTNAHDKLVIESLSDLVVHLPALGYGTTEFDMSDQRRDALIAGGRIATEQYLENRKSSDTKGDDRERSDATRNDRERMERAQQDATRIAELILP